MIYKTFALFVLLFSCSYAAAINFKSLQYQEAFLNFMHEHGKSYASDEFQGRFATFKKNMDFINSHNARGDASFKVAINQFADMENSEFAAMYNGLRVPEGYVHEADFVSTQEVKDLPAAWDWRHEGAVTGVKNQGQCGSCWAFSTTGSTEGCHFLTTKHMVGLSEQNLVDCSRPQGNLGCNGGLMTSAMNYIKIAGIDTESSYPYTAHDGTCKFNPANVGSKLSTFTNIQRGSESDLQKALYQGPVSVAIDASQSSFQFYHSGVYSDNRCSSSQLDHGVLAVGWGSAEGKDYWIVKNSWGTSWGNQGYIWMARNSHNMCGIATMATIPKNCN